MTSFPQTILMCSPDHFEVVYVINPWMEGQFANTDSCGVSIYFPQHRLYLKWQQRRAS